MLDHKGEERRGEDPLGGSTIRSVRGSTIRSVRGSTVKAAIDFSLDHKDL